MAATDRTITEVSCISSNVASASSEMSYRTFGNSPGPQTPKVYRSRFLMLALLSLCTLLNGFQLIQYSIITSIVTCYYDVSVAVVNLTSLVFNFMIFPFMFPVAWLLNNKGMKYALVIGAGGNAIGACIQCFSLAPDKFYVVMITQIVTSISQEFYTCLPAYIAAVWFGPKELSIACAVATVANQVGTAIGCIVPPLLVPAVCNDVSNIRYGLGNLAMGQAFFNTAVFIAIVIFFKDKPPIPPSFAELNKPSTQQPTCWSLLAMFKNLHFCLLWIANGLGNSVFATIQTLVNQMVVRLFPGKEIEAGWIGLELTFSGIIGCLLCGYLLDRTHKFKELSIAVCFTSFFFISVYAGVYSIAKLWMYFILFAFIGFVMQAVSPVLLQFALEITYPNPEGSTALLFVASSSLFVTLVTVIASWLQQTFGDIYSNLFFCSCSGGAFIISIFIKGENKRTMQNHLAKREP